MKTEDQLSPAQLHIIQHSLGCDQFGRGSMYRNRFITDADSDDGRECSQLVEMGLMGRKPLGGDWCGDSLFWVTESGVEAMKSASPSPPKRTAAQRRYDEYLSADSGLSFIEWLKTRKNR
jgi:hypothetical protein